MGCENGNYETGKSIWEANWTRIGETTEFEIFYLRAGGWIHQGKAGMVDNYVCDLAFAYADADFI